MNHTIQVNGANFHVHDSGMGKPALVFLHFFGGSSRSWNEVIKVMRSTHRCIAPDLRGFGDSEATPGGYSVAESADDVAALLGVLQVKKYVLVGHSMGGKIVLALAARAPVGLAGVLLIAPSPPSPEPMTNEDRMRLLHSYGDRDAMEETISQITANPLPVAVFERTVEDNLKSSHVAWQAWLEGGSCEDITEEMSNIRVPTAIIAGAKDKVMTPALLQREIADKLPQSRQRIVVDAGHLIPLEKPEKTRNSIVEILSVL